MLALLLLHACAGPGDTGAAPDTAAPDDTAAEPWTGPCPPGAVQIDTFCIDAWETTLTGDLGPADQGDTWPESATTAIAAPIEGVIPSVPLSWYQASAACSNAGKHLCTVTEWQEACGKTTLPWGEEPPAVEVCAIPAEDQTTEWTELQPTGSLPDCRSPEGVYDQIGNAWEWADAEATGPEGAPKAAKMGGAYYAGPGNANCVVGPFLDHPPEFSGTIAARCCVDAR
ncbi:MAG: SUMF1/EgtB/PvdO family nonheme iron enzyme [Pseudomonadota bacterium]|nr:SUMF1/EgtB/PvdO family nonheme iron enzyme [Pseudomonadota bacterium]